MPTTTRSTDPEGLAVPNALTSSGLPVEDAYLAMEGIRNMAGHSIIATLEAHKGEINGKLDAVNSNIDALKGQLRCERSVL